MIFHWEKDSCSGSWPKDDSEFVKRYNLENNEARYKTNAAPRAVFDCRRYGSHIPLEGRCSFCNEHRPSSEGVGGCSSNK